MAFSAEELRVLRRALALALNPSPVPDEDVQDCLRLAESVDEAMRESARLRAFLVADLSRYRAALPGTAAGYLALLDDVLGAGYQPGPDDLAALRALRGNTLAAALLDRCRTLAERSVRARLAGRSLRAQERPTVPASRTPLRSLPGGRGAVGQDPPQDPARPVPTPAEVFPPRRRPAPSTEPPTPPTPPATPDPAPTPAPSPTPAGPSHQLAAG
ncbi:MULTISPECIES: hypothetical protein [Streptomyces]|uniref:hypothetical protein n=1 Tax=Streptomyces TaxID=1883 RepID=UPI001E403BBA|nr:MULTISPECIES: hypothetical protein [Streptomyces]UFQ20280.1 hypothetical protein J2N69_20835 [Streptomyces huasconensis]WCL89897.1 hypothetical protein PPN52_20840 [Streptomyces sp. JCM 35825]